MEETFWHKCWEKDHIGFHQDDFHPLLLKSFNDWAGKANQNIFVPLCGKSLDMLYLAQSHNVVGSELSDIACRDFFQEAGIVCQVAKQSRYERYTGANIELLAGDFFALQAADINGCTLIYDRAALIAFPAQMRERYVANLRSLFATGARLFLLTLEYPDDELKGPPFAVHEDEVYRLFDGCDIEKIESLDCVEGKFARREFNVSKMCEVLYCIKW